MKMTQVSALVSTLATFVRGYSFSDSPKTSNLLTSNSDLNKSTSLTADEENRIIGGLVTTIVAFPYVVNLRLEYPDSKNYYSSTSDLVKKPSEQQILVVERSRHPKCNVSTQEYDVGLLKLKTPSSQEPASLCAANGSDNEVGMMATVLG
ncbi:hypothetical protein BBJ29_001608 [Phytophthora kernoviae]|uniref:Peptidase S1 domain-containing protein n=1 Tax=Phytophthora kernoviae TaxID=325452 RepID=A0A3F2RWD2_9STRA|nr:hypothetical protein BBJ29_001608 [Phytophthora kernoviae]RLN65521.1 hypothetical protein BBP00_00002797 [Phytophthora kernoviae]